MFECCVGLKAADFGGFFLTQNTFPSPCILAAYSFPMYTKHMIELRRQSNLSSLKICEQYRWMEYTAKELQFQTGLVRVLEEGLVDAHWFILRKEGNLTIGRMLDV